MNIVINADGGRNIGMGHIMRTLVLAKELRNHNQVSYVCRQDEQFEMGRKKVEEEGFYVYNKLSTGGDVLITDSYEVNDKYFEEVRKHYNYLIYIDDLNLFYHNVDLLINQNINAEELNYSEKNLLLGARYVLLRDEFRSCVVKPVKEQVTDILITMGGADPHNFSAQLVCNLMKLGYNLHVVVGPAFSNKDTLSSFQGKKVRLYENADMKELMEKCDIAVSACGSTLYELCACGTPCYGVILAENQRKSAEKFRELGIVTNIYDYRNIDWILLGEDVNNLCNNYEKRKEVSRSMQSMVDGNGAKRIADYIETHLS